MGKVLATPLVALMLTVGVGGIVRAGPLEDGNAAYQRGDITTALRLLRPLAEQGNAYAQFSLGVMYAKGQGVTQDYKEAMEWYRRSADQGFAIAQSNLGVMYANGQGVTQDYKAAVKWLRLAAEQSNANAQSNLGAMYAKGQGVTQDFLRAYMWLNLAASKFSGVDGQRATSNRDRIAKSLTPAQIVQAQEMARQCEAQTSRTASDPLLSIR